MGSIRNGERKAYKSGLFSFKKIFKIHNLFSQINTTLILPFRKDFLSASHFKNALKKIAMNVSIKVRLEKKED